MPTQIPKLDVGKCAVIFAEKDTGILLTTGGNRYLGVGEFYRVFDPEREAEHFARSYARSNPKVECSIRDRKGGHLRYVAS
jgi:hypothetical protein